MRHRILCSLLLFSIAPWSKATPLKHILFGGQLTEKTYLGAFLYKSSVASQANDSIFANALQEFTQQVIASTRINFSKAEKSKDKNKLEKTAEKSLKRESLVSGFVDALTLLYDTVSDMLLYPAFSFLFLIMTVVLIFLVVQLVVKIRKDKTTPARNLLFLLALHLLIYADLFMVMYDKRKVLFLFMTFQKDLALVIAAALIGFLLGRSVSRNAFEDRNMP